VPTRSERFVRRASRARRGISLFEAVVAIAVVGMTAVSALESVGAGMRSAEKSRRAIEAEALASSRLDFLDLMNDRELQTLPDSVEAGTFPKPLDEYSWKTTSAAYAEQPGVYDVRITITWPTGSYTVKTYVYRQPPIATRR
jgi:type II secretory pathway pseudopilin PulG